LIGNEPWLGNSFRLYSPGRNYLLKGITQFLVIVDNQKTLTAIFNYFAPDALKTQPEYCKNWGVLTNGYAKLIRKTVQRPILAQKKRFANNG
jgi:hypothetical protein